MNDDPIATKIVDEVKAWTHEAERLMSDIVQEDVWCCVLNPVWHIMYSVDPRRESP